MRIVWLKPTKGYVSVGRNLIANYLGEMGCDVKILECSGLRIFRVFLDVLRSDFDILVGTTHLGLAVGGLLKILKRKPFVADFVDRFDILYHMHSPALYPLIWLIILMEKISLKLADERIVIPLKDQRTLGGVRLNLCTDLEKFFNVNNETVKYAKNLLIKNGVDIDKPLVVYIGSFNPIYNLHILLNSMKLLEDVQLILVGGGKMERELKELKRKLNLKNVFFMDYQPHSIIPGILCHCDVGVTLAEVPRQLKVYEYLASGLSVVVPKSILKSEDFDFPDLCVGVDINVNDVARGIRIALKSKLDIDKNKLKKYDCRYVAGVYYKVFRRALNEGRVNRV